MQNNLQSNTKRGVTLLVAILVVSLVLAIGLAILNVTLKQFILSGVSRDSAVAFYAADAGLECGKYWDRSPALPGGTSEFNGSVTDLACFDVAYTVDIGGGGGIDTYTMEEMSLGSNDELCATVVVTKYNSGSDENMTATRRCPAGFSCTKIESRGYNQSCGEYDTNSRTVERALRAFYGGCVIGSNCP